MKVQLSSKRFMEVIGMNITCFLYKHREKSTQGKVVFSVFQFILRLFNMSVFPVVNAKKYQEQVGRVELKIIEKKRKGVTANTIMAGSNENVVLSEYPLPDMRQKTFHNVCITGNSDIVVDVANGYVISEEAYDVVENNVIIDGLLFRTKNNACLLRNNMMHKGEHIPLGIMISGKFSNNYYHVMYENLIRILYVNRGFIPKDVPLIVDKKTMSIPSCKRIFDILTEELNRPVLQIESTTIYHFDILYCLDHVNKLPSHSSNPHKPSVVVYYQPALMDLRNCLIKHKSSQPFPKRVFISRANSPVRHFNEQEVFQMLSKHGFDEAFPEKLSFEEQMSLFAGAEFVVAGSGAALTNLLFVNNSCNIICFGRSSYNENCEVPIFNTLANLNGAKFLYFPRKNKVDNSIHVDYEIDCNYLEQTIYSLLQ